MEVSLYQAAAAMNATEQWQEMVADNLATSSTPGTRRREISFAAVQAGYPSETSDPNSPGFILTQARTVTSFQQGELHPSGNTMDMALEGPGFFAVQMPDGQTAYTRDGEFQISSKGELVTLRGFPVLGSSGPIQFNPGNSAPITVSAAGDVSQGQDKKGKLQVSNFDQPDLLTGLGGGLYRADDPNLSSTDTTNTHVRQGFVENSNTTPTMEMSGLLTAMRMFEANQKVISMQSDRMSREITDLGSPASA